MEERFGVAWVALTAALAAHVVDEATTGFLDVYNPIVRSMRSRYSWSDRPGALGAGRDDSAAVDCHVDRAPPKGVVPSGAAL